MAWREWMMMHVGPGALSGVTLGHWARLLWENGFRVHPRHWMRAFTITRQSVTNSLWRRWEELRFGRSVRAVEVPPPLFVLGIWRSGTTHLHNLLTKDERFAFPTSYQVCFPHSFLTTEWFEAPLMSRAMPRVRPQDNVALGMHEPQEEEFALVNMTKLSSYYSWVFPRRAAAYDRYLTFAEATMGEIAQWQAALQVAYEELERDPLGELRRIYRELSLPDFSAAEPAVRTYLDSLQGYQKNQFTSLEPAMQERIAHQWRRCFDEWGYSPRRDSVAQSSHLTPRDEGITPRETSPQRT
jgi:hypothetical protein